MYSLVFGLDRVADAVPSAGKLLETEALLSGIRFACDLGFGDRGAGNHSSISESDLFPARSSLRSLSSCSWEE